MNFELFGLVVNVLTPEVIKHFFLLNSDEYEIRPANKLKITQNCKFFLAKHS